MRVLQLSLLWKVSYFVSMSKLAKNCDASDGIGEQSYEIIVTFKIYKNNILWR